MNNKRILNGLILGIFLILSTMFVSGQTATLSTPLEYANVTDTVTLTVTVADAHNVSNVTFYGHSPTTASWVICANTTTGLNDFALTGITCTWDTSIDADISSSFGLYNELNITAEVLNDTEGTYYSEDNVTNVRISVSNTAPTITFDSVSSPGDSTYNNTGSAVFNLSTNVTDLVYGAGLTCAYTVDGSSTNRIITETSNDTHTNTSVTAEGSHSWYVTCNNSAGLSTTTATRSFVYDVTNPNSTVSIVGTKNGQQDQTLTAGGEIDFGTEVTINCGVNDTTSGINTTRSSISILYPGVANYQNVSSSLITSANQTLSVDLLRVDTDTLGEMRILCTLVDLAGNDFTRYYNLTTITVVNQGTSAFAAEGFEAPVGKIKLSSGTVSDAGRLTTEGESRLMKVNSAIKFDMVGEEHKIEVIAASTTEVTVKVTSEAQEVTITAGESESVDVNGDGIADLEMTYHKLFSGSYADITFALTSEAVEVSDEVEEVEDMISETESEEYVEQKGGLTVTLAVIVIILIIGYALIKGKKK